MTLPVWKGLYRTIQDYLYSITLQDIIDNTVNTAITSASEERRIIS